MSLVLLNLLHICDGSFPIGAASYSHSLEGMVQQGAIADAADIAALLRAVLNEGMARCELVAVHAAYTYAMHEEHDALVHLDTLLAAMTPVAEWRQASRALARRTLASSMLLTTSRAMEGYMERLTDGTCTGQHPVAFAVVAAALNTGQHAAALGYAYAETMARLSAAIRLLPLGQNAAQMIVHQLKPVMEQAASRASMLTLDQMGPCLPALELAGMVHQRAPARLFAS